MTIKQKNILFLILIILMNHNLLAQAPVGNMSYQYLSEKRDTILIDSKFGDWWFGISGGANLNTYFGEAIAPYFPLRPVDSVSNPLLHYSPEIGGGYYIGLLAEWLPTGGNWGALLNIRLYDFRNSTSEADPRKLDTINYKYTHRTMFSYITLSPSIRYNFDDSGLHAFLGGDIEFVNPLVKQNSEMEISFEHTGDIKEKWVFSSDTINRRYGVHLGLGWDFFVMNINHNVRVNLTPYISFHGGTNIISDFNSNLNTIMVKFGIGVKFGPAKVKRDTLFYDPTYKAYVPELASADIVPEVTFPGFQPMDYFPSQELAYVPKAEIVQEISEKTTEASEKPTAESEAEEPEIDINPGRTEIFTYPNSSDTKLPDQVREYLDEAIKFLAANPSYEIRIEGHSDNSGTFEQRQSRSEARAIQAEQYLMKNGVPKRKIFWWKRGAFRPIARGNSEAARQKNRRIEIRIVQ